MRLAENCGRRIRMMKQGKRHVVLTGEIGVGKSTALLKALELFGGEVRGIQTYSPGASGVMPRNLYMRPYGSTEDGTLITVLPMEDRGRVTALFDVLGVSLLRAARESGADLLVIDECGRLERDAQAYHEALRACLDGCKPMLIAMRKHKAEWADFIREHPAVQVIEVTQDNRDDLPQAVCAALQGSASNI